MSDLSKLEIGQEVWWHRHTSLIVSGKIVFIKNTNKKSVCIDTSYELVIAEIDNSLFTNKQEAVFAVSCALQKQASDLLITAANLISTKKGDQP